MANGSRDDSLCIDRIRNGLSAIADEVCTEIELFSEIDSTNRWLLEQAPPIAGTMRSAVADYQTRGRGRRGRRWELPPGAGICLSVAWTFADRPAHISSLALAIGVASVAALDSVGCTGVKLKWPNDLIYSDGKLGGILVESIGTAEPRCTIVVGIGINRILPAGFSETIKQGEKLAPTDLARAFAGGAPPSRNEIVAALISGFAVAFREFSANGFVNFRPSWQALDYLSGRTVEVTRGENRMTGRANGIGEAGELLVAAQGNGPTIVSIDSGSVTPLDASDAAVPDA